jgi:ferredoxin
LQFDGIHSIKAAHLFQKPFLKRGRMMKAVVDEKTCVGCGLCSDNCAAVFEMDGSIAKVKVAQVPAAEEAACKDAAANCPVEAITIS